MIIQEINATVNGNSLSGEVIVPSPVLTSTKQAEDGDLTKSPNFQLKLTGTTPEMNIIDSVQVEFTNGDFNYTANMTVVNSQQNGTVILQYVDGLTVEEAEPEPTGPKSISEVKQLEDNTEFTFDGTVTVINKTSNNRELYIQDADGTAGIKMFQNNIGSSFATGDVIYGGWSGTKYIYQDATNIKNITNLNYSGDKAQLVANEASISSFTDSDTINYYVFRNITTDGNNIYDDMNHTMPIYNQFGVTFPSNARKCDAYGIVTWYRNKPQFYPMSFEPVGGSEPDIYYVSTGNISNATVTFDKEEGTEGETITTTVTPDSGYVLNTIDVVGNTTGTIIDVELLSWTRGEYSFIMPAEDVIVNVECIDSFAFEQARYECSAVYNGTTTEYTDAEVVFLVNGVATSLSPSEVSISGISSSLAQYIALNDPNDGTYGFRCTAQSNISTTVTVTATYNGMTAAATLVLRRSENIPDEPTGPHFSSPVDGDNITGTIDSELCEFRWPIEVVGSDGNTISNDVTSMCVTIDGNDWVVGSTEDYDEATSSTIITEVFIACGQAATGTATLTYDDSDTGETCTATFTYDIRDGASAPTFTYWGSDQNNPIICNVTLGENSDTMNDFGINIGVDGSDYDYSSEHTWTPDISNGVNSDDNDTPITGNNLGGGIVAGGMFFSGTRTAGTYLKSYTLTFVYNKDYSQITDETTGDQLDDHVAQALDGTTITFWVQYNVTDSGSEPT